MKCVIFLGDGMSDHPVASLNGRTPLMAAHTPNLDRMVREGIGGWVKNAPDHMYPGSDTTNLSVLGYDPVLAYTGRSPLEAAAMGIELAADDVAFRCNLVTLSPDHAVMEEFSAGHISTAESERLIADLNLRLGSESFRFFPGFGYRHILVWRHGQDAFECAPPHDIMGKPVANHLPRGEAAHVAVLNDLMRQSWEILADHPVNRERRAQGKSPATSIWLWGQGRKPVLEPFQQRYGISGGIISAVDLLKGIGVHLGLEVMQVDGATGWIDTNYQGKMQACLNGLTRHDLMFIHVEAPDESGHAGRLDYKLQAIEDLDRQIIGPVLEALHASGKPFRALALPDHPTLLETKTHAHEPVPFALYGTGIVPDQNTTYDERLLTTGSRTFEPGHTMMRYVLTA